MCIQCTWQLTVKNIHMILCVFNVIGNPMSNTYIWIYVYSMHLAAHCQRHTYENMCISNTNIACRLTSIHIALLENLLYLRQRIRLGANQYVKNPILINKENSNYSKICISEPTSSCFCGHCQSAIKEKSLHEKIKIACVLSGRSTTIIEVPIPNLQC